MNNFLDLMRVRRSHRKFTDEQITADELRELVRAALLSPSSKGLHSTDLVTVTNPRTLAHLSQCKAQGGEMLATAPAAIVVCGKPEVSDAWIEDASVASTAMLLQAEDMGLGACWVQIRERKDSEGRDAEANVRRLLDIPAEVRILCIIALGHKGMERKPQNEERLKWEQLHEEDWLRV